MPDRKEQFANDEIYHITSRRIGDELLFKDIHDYFRGIFSIYELNNSSPVSIFKRREERARFKIAARSGLVGLQLQQTPTLPIEEDKRNRFVDILTFVLMPNHIHLLVKQLLNNGISKFMQKFGGGYAGYFKEKYKEKGKGYFFKDRFYAVHIENDEQLKTAFVYDHTNPIALIEPGWKEKGIVNPQKVIEFLENEYRWSSYWDYLGKKNFPSVTERNFLSEIVGGPKGCKDFVDNWVNYKGEIFNLSKKFKELNFEED